MEQLKKILRLALGAGAQRIRLNAGAHIEVTSAQGVQQVAAETPIDDAYLHNLFGFLFANEKAQLAARQVTKGQLAIPNVGRLLLIAQPQPPSGLYLYVPPNGQPLFDADWAKLAHRTVAAEAPPPAGLPMSGFIPAGMGADLPAPAPALAPAIAAPLPMGGAVPLGFPQPTLPLAAPAAAQPAPLPLGGAIPMGFPAGNPSLPTIAPISAPTPLPMSAPLGFPAAAPAPAPANQAMPHAMPMPVTMPMLSTVSTPGAMPITGAVPMPGAMPFPSGAQASAPPMFPDPVPAAQNYGGGGFDKIEIDYSPSPARGQGGGGIGRPHAEDDDGPVKIAFSADAGSVDVSTGRNPIDPVLSEMVKRRASDLHMTCGEPYCYRVDGEIQRIGQSPVGPDEMERYLLPIMPERNQREFAKINDTDFAYEIRGVGRFRVNVFRDKNGVGSVMRHIPSKILTAEQLQLPHAITKFCGLTKGLVVVTGPTGSGKSTTLAAMVDLINKQRHDHILTVEDPIEFVHPQQKCLVNQREVHRHTGSFARALRAALREDPDIVLVGEMRDLETVAIAIETAETGHLVFGTLHTNTAVSTVDRIVQQFPHEQQEAIRMMLASSLKGVVAQTLLKKKGGGRIAAHEILVVNDAVSAMIREGKNHMIPNHMQTQKVDGNVMLNESLAKHVKDGLVDAEEAFRKAVDKVAIIDALKRVGVNFNDPGAQPARGAAPQQGRRPA